MPNWAMGDVTVTGTRDGITSFISRFVTEDDPRTIPGKRFFARSFLDDRRPSVTDEIPEPATADEQITYTFPVSFAWSAYSCVVSGYPERNQEECITLKEACIEDQVEVRITTIEYGMCLEEEIQCTAAGELEVSERSLRQARCPSCGEIQSVGSFDELSEVECSECYRTGLEEVL